MVCKDFPSEEATRLHCNCKCISLWCCSSVESGGFHSCTWKSSLLRIFKICNQFNTTHKNVWIASRNMALGPFSMLQNLIWLWLIWLNYQLCILSTSGELSTSLHSKYLSTSALNIQLCTYCPWSVNCNPLTKRFYLQSWVILTPQIKRLELNTFLHVETCLLFCSEDVASMCKWNTTPLLLSASCLHLDFQLFPELAILAQPGSRVPTLHLPPRNNSPSKPYILSCSYSSRSLPHLQMDLSSTESMLSAAWSHLKKEHNPNHHLSIPTADAAWPAELL